jgi:protein-S-isoprenylcysteine O-methyltransferase Ste14
MKASAIEFRLRMLIIMAIVMLGFWAPWNSALSPGWQVPLSERLPLELSRLGLLSFTIATPVVIISAASLAGVGAILRVWGAAWLGPGIVLHGQMQAGTVMADGPYRYVRNPLYVGVWLLIAALGLLMSPTGALFTMVLLTVFLLRLILGEEGFLSAQLGDPYMAYLRSAPRLIPRLRSTLPRTGRKPHWIRGVLSEITPIGIFVTLAFLSWTYNNRLMEQAVIVSFGVGLVMRAFTLGISKDSSSPK